MNLKNWEVADQLLERARSDDIARYFHQLRALLKAGISLSHALDLMSEQATCKALRSASKKMARRAVDGQSWSEAMQEYPGVFPVFTRAIIRAAEESGFLEQACEILAHDAEQEYAIQQLLKRETWYPNLLLLISTFLPIKIGPYFTLSPEFQIFVLLAVWIPWLVISFLWPVIPPHSPFRRKIDENRLKLPIVGKVVKALAGARFCRFLAMSYSAGVSLPRGTALAAAACGNVVLADKLRKAIPQLLAGEQLAATLIATGVIPKTAVPLLVSGEITGDLETQLQAAARFLEADARAALRETVIAFGVCWLIVVGAKIGTFVIQSHLGIH